MAALVLAIAAILVPSGAAANDIQGCQGAGAELSYIYYSPSGSNTLRSWVKNCSKRYSLNSEGYSLRSGGWSGYITFANGDTDYFCNDWHVPLSRQRVVEIVMASDRIYECGG
jgi:hypothetical protein